VQRKTDNELVQLARSGDKQAFGELLQRYQAMAMSIARSMLGQEEVARELVQEAFLAAYLSLRQLREDTRFKSWLYSIVLNVCRSYIRSQKGTTYSLEALLGGTRGDALACSDAWIDPQEVVEERELHQLVLNAVQSLSPKERIATLLFYYEQFSIHEIATLLDISETAVKSRLFQARKRLANRSFATHTPEADQQGDNRLW
jgi:RNA polymerase sigma factor (sigma-70 family)